MTSPTSGPSFLLAFAIACGDAATGVPPERMTTGGEESTGGSGDGTTAVPGPDTCEASEDCGEDGFCVASYDPGASERGAAACVATCVAEDDLVRWCIDDAACCEGLSCNAVDGFCVAGSVDGTSSSGGSGSGSSESSSGSGSGSSSSSDSGSDSSSSSSSSGAT